MHIAENTLLILLPILLLGLLVPEMFRRLKLPWVTSLILVGAIMGPNGIGYIQHNETVSFFGFLGLAFLMLMAGLETDVESLKHSKRQILTLVLSNGLLPFFFGFLVTWVFGYGIWSALVVGTVFISSSVAIAVPTIRSYVFRREGDGEVMVTAIVVEDALSLFILAIILQSFSPITDLPLPQYFVALVISVLFLRRVVPKLAKKFFASRLAGETKHETQLRFVIVLLLAVLIFFSFLGVHPIIAAFLVGILLSRVVTSSQVISKLHTIGYGLFVPVFFFIVGMEMDLGSVLFSADWTSFFVLVLIAVFFVAKCSVATLAVRQSVYHVVHRFFSVLPPCPS